MYKQIMLAAALMLTVSTATCAATTTKAAPAPNLAADGRDTVAARPVAASRYKRIRAKAHRNAARAKAHARALRAAEETKS